MKRRSYDNQQENQQQQRQPSPTGARKSCLVSVDAVGSPLRTAAATTNGPELDSRSHAAASKPPKKPRCRKVAARCRVPTCSARPWYGEPGTQRPKACKDHRADGEVNVYAPACQAEGCSTRPHYGGEGQRPTFCRSHKLPGMVDLLNKQCKRQGCKKQPSFSVEGGGRALFCKDHKEDGMLNTRRKTCAHPGCSRIPSKSDGPPPLAPSASTSKDLGNRGPEPGTAAVDGGGNTTPNQSTPSGKLSTESSCKSAKSTESNKSIASGGEEKAWGAPKYCAAHAPQGSVDVVSMRCREPGCTTQPSFGWEGSGEPAMFCARHRKKGMTDVKNPRCWTVGCVAQPRFARKGDVRPTSCLKHADPRMLDVRLTKYRKTAPPAKQKKLDASAGAS